MKNFTFSFPTQVIFGRDAETHAGALSAPFGPNVMLLYGSDRIRRSGLLGRLTADLEAHGLTVTLFGGIQENPVLSTAEEGRRLAKEKKITLLLAVGGGSVIDTAKAISWVPKTASLYGNYTAAKPKLSGPCPSAWCSPPPLPPVRPTGSLSSATMSSTKRRPWTSL